VNIAIMRTFVRLREILATHKDLARRLEELEKKYDTQLKVVFDAIRQLMTPPPEPENKRRIGFGRDGRNGRQVDEPWPHWTDDSFYIPLSVGRSWS
jgi:hypothetical protein